MPRGEHAMKCLQSRPVLHVARETRQKPKEKTAVNRDAPSPFSPGRIRAMDCYHSSCKRGCTTTRQERDWITTCRGSRAGSPLADVSFMIAMEEIGHCLDEALRDESTVVKIAEGIEVPTIPIIWADDLALLVPADDNEDPERSREDHG